MPNLCVLFMIISLAAVARAVLTGPDVALVRISHKPMGRASVSYCRAIPRHQHRKRDLDEHANLGHPHHQEKLEDAKASNKEKLEDAKASNTAKPTTSPPPLTTVDLTPAKLNTSCYPGTFQAPSLEDCEVVIRAQLYNSTGSLQVSPGDYVFVSYGSCATVFQNPQYSNYTVQYNWAELGYVGGKLAGRCLLPEDHSMGGTAVFDTYLGRTYPDVIISLQRFDDRDFIIPE